MYWNNCGFNYPLFANNKDKEVPKMEWIISNWSKCLAIFWMAERAVNHTSNPYDDILIDIVWSGIKKATGKNKPE